MTGAALTVMLMGISFAPRAHGSSGSCQTQNVVQAFTDVSLKSELFVRDSGQKLTESYLVKAIKIKDVKNGYLELNDKDINNRSEAALFKGKSRRNFLAIVISGGSSDRALLFACDATGGKWTPHQHPLFSEISRENAILLYKKRGFVGLPLVELGKGRKLDEAVLSDYAGSLVSFKLPRVGRTIKRLATLDDSSVFGKTLDEFEFDGESFKQK